MDETVNDYARYERLILEKDRLEKEAELYYEDYVRAFGPLTADAFALKIDCISLKKEIALYLAARNAGKRPDAAAIEAALQKQMLSYRLELSEMREKNDLAQKLGEGRVLSFSEIDKIKALYRKLAKLLHPDLSPLTREKPELDDLFRKVIDAYKRNDLKALQSCEVFLYKWMEAHGVDGFQMQIDDLDARIAALEEDLQSIVTTVPYIYGALLADPVAFGEKKERLEKEIREYSEYKNQLEAQLASLKAELLPDT